MAGLRLVQHHEAPGAHRPQPANGCTGGDRSLDRHEVLGELDPQVRPQPGPEVTTDGR